MPDPNIFLWIAASVADAATFNPNGIKTLLATNLSIFFIKGNPVFGNGHKSLPKNYSYCPILCNWIFNNFMLHGEQPAKSFRNLKSYVNNKF